MKKILLGFALSLATLSFAQQYPDNGWGDNGSNGNNNGYYSDQDDQNNFPNDYYYNYPQDYYPSGYYQNYYNDYRNSISNINWNVFFAQNRLNRWQIDQVLRLNNLYVGFTAWDNFYRYNPDRWYYDRFYALERILGPRVFVTFQNNYYHGSSPIGYFQNYRRTYYVPRYRVMPHYRNVNINVYRVDRAKFRGTNNPSFNIVRSSREDNGFRGSGRDGNSGGFRSQSNNGGRDNNNSGGFRGSNSGGFRNDNNEVRNGGSNGGGFRSNTEGNKGNDGNRGGFRNQEIKRESAPRREENNGGGFRQQRTENSTPREQNNNAGDNRGGGFRQRLVKN